MRNPITDLGDQGLELNTEFIILYSVILQIVSVGVNFFDNLWPLKGPQTLSFHESPPCRRRRS